MALHPSPTEHVGKRIRLYRKKSGYTLLEFSHMIHRSVSAISKYENGLVSIDVDTLFDIAEALGISVNQLTDYQTTARKKKEIGGGNFFRKRELFYMYQYSGFDKRVNRFILEIAENPEDEKDQVMLYYGYKDIKDYTKCESIYRGEITYSDSYVNIQASNPFNAVDKISIYAKATSSPHQTKVNGVILALAESLRNPYSAKAIISTEPLEINATLLEQLMINDKDSLADIRKANAMVIY